MTSRLSDIVDEQANLQERVRKMEVLPWGDAPIRRSGWAPGERMSHFLASLITGFSHWKSETYDSLRMTGASKLLRDMCWDAATWNIQPQGSVDGHYPLAAVANAPDNLYGQALAWEWTMLLQIVRAMPPMDYIANQSPIIQLQVLPHAVHDALPALGPTGGKTGIRSRLGGATGAAATDYEPYEKIIEWADITQGGWFRYGSPILSHGPPRFFPIAEGMAAQLPGSLVPLPTDRWYQYPGPGSRDARGGWYYSQSDNGTSYTYRYYTGNHNAVYAVGTDPVAYFSCFAPGQSPELEPGPDEIAVSFANQGIGGGIDRDLRTILDANFPCPEDPTGEGPNNNTGGFFMVGGVPASAWYSTRPPLPYEGHAYGDHIRDGFGSGEPMPLAASENWIPANWLNAVEDRVNFALTDVIRKAPGVMGQGSFPRWWGDTAGAGGEGAFPLIRAWVENWMVQIDAALRLEAENSGWMPLETPAHMKGLLWYRLEAGVCHLRGTVEALGDDTERFGSGVGPSWIAHLPIEIDWSPAAWAFLHPRDAETGQQRRCQVIRRNTFGGYYHNRIEYNDTARSRVLHFDGVAFRVATL